MQDHTADFSVVVQGVKGFCPEGNTSGFPAVDEWVEAFKQKRGEIVNRRCA